MTIATLPRDMWIALGGAAVLMTILYLYLFIRAVRLYRLRAIVPAGIGLAALYLLLQFLASVSEGDPAGRLPAAAAAAILLSAVPTSFLLLWDQRRLRRTQLSATSVKEAVDSLDTGLCYYRDDGRVLLRNLVMDRISLGLTGGTVLNGDELWALVRAGGIGRGFTIIQVEGSPVVRFDGGRTYSFSRSRVALDRESVWELTAADVTDEFALVDQLRKDKELLEQQNVRLLEVRELVVQNAIRRQLLQLKLRLHDEIGAVLIATRTYLQGVSRDRDSLLSLWHRLLDLFRADAPPPPAPQHDPYRPVLTMAKDIGVTVAVTGTLPRGGAAPVLARTVSECIINMIRHAGGDRVEVDCTATETTDRVSVTTFGRAPEGPVDERGGLQSLRHVIETMGGEMTVEHAPRFRLTVTLPKGVNTHV